MMVIHVKLELQQSIDMFQNCLELDAFSKY
jgi:hypothetical protein